MSALLVALLLGCGVPDLPEVPRRPSILLITLDTTRADHLPTYGYFRNTTPTLGNMASRSIVFERFMVPMATTLPTHTSILTGVHPLEHGVVANLKHGGKSFAPSEALIPFTALVKAARYQTAAFTSATPLKSGTGIEEAFDHWDESRGPSRIASRTTDVARTWLLRRRPKRPFFAWVHYFDAHTPLEPPAPYDVSYRDEPALRGWLEARGVVESERRSGIALDPVEAANLYDGELRFIDDQVGRLLDAVQRAGWADRTIVIVVGDHGEGLGQHGESGHGTTWTEQLHAPFWIFSPWHAARRVAVPVTAEDVFPTLLGLVDIPGAEAFLAQASGVDALSPAARRPLLHMSSAHRAQLGESAEASLTVGEWRYHQDTSGAETLYDLGADPFERVSVADAFPLHARLLGTWTREVRAARDRRGQVLGTTREVSLDPERVQQLEALGYTE
ncbi:MAG: choline-sulfatase [Myxococcota bacterium]